MSEKEEAAAIQLREWIFRNIEYPHLMVPWEELSNETQVKWADIVSSVISALTLEPGMAEPGTDKA